jgi:signal transduction histidine kinase
MSQLLVNLVVNAIHAMPNSGRLTIKTVRDGEDIFLTVEDTGMGMSDEVRKRIFDPFFTTKDVKQGTGLGLSVVHGIVTGHGGSIEVDSRIGHGSCFNVRLPTGNGKTKGKPERKH